MARRRTKPPLIARRPEQSFRQRISRQIETLVGQTVVEWSRVEQVMEEVIWRLLRVTVDEGRIVTASLDAKYKMNLLRGLGKRHLRGQQHDDLMQVLDHCEDLLAERNLYSHGQWVTITPDNLPAVISLREKLPEGISRQEVISITMPADRMKVVVRNMVIARNALIELRRALPVPSPGTPSAPPQPET